MDIGKKITQKKTFAQDVFDRRWSLDEGKDTGQKYQCEIFNFVDLCNGVGIVCMMVDHNPNTSQWCHWCHFLR